MTSYLKDKTLFPPQITTEPSTLLNKIVVIPCYDEATALNSLVSLKNCQQSEGHTEVILVINQSSKEKVAVKKLNDLTHLLATTWASTNSTQELKFYSLFLEKLPPKHAGVGLARKIGMDEAAYRLEKVGRPDGVIICYDADSNCDPDYLIEIERHFKQHPKTQAASIYYEHPTEGPGLSLEVYQSIIDYELHLRYYINALRFAGHPHAYQTIGSSMAVRCDAYQQQGGMNRKKAGEDFYFLHKFIPLGQFAEINSTRVIPSSRRSHRVPFGTGKAVQDRLDNYEEGCSTYALDTFKALRQFLDTVPALYDLIQVDDSASMPNYPLVIQGFMEQVELMAQCRSIYKNTSNKPSFVKRFYRWFDAFRVLKFVHYARDTHFPDEPVMKAALGLLEAMEEAVDPSSTNLQLLEIYRKRDKNSQFAHH